MPLFEFELLPVEDIRPFGERGKETLSWFALTDGFFRIRAGNAILFRYSDAFLAPHGSAARDASYYLASLARDMLVCVVPGAAPLPESVERLAADWDALERLRKQAMETDEELGYTAFRWLGERSPWTSYLNLYPVVSFLRIGDEVRVHWDNRERVLDGVPMWSAEYGMYAMPVAAFLAEGRDFAERLLGAMEQRIAGIESGAVHPQMAVDLQSLRKQHETWSTEFMAYFDEREPDIPWDETEEALRAVGG